MGKDAPCRELGQAPVTAFQDTGELRLSEKQNDVVINVPCDRRGLLPLTRYGKNLLSVSLAKLALLDDSFSHSRWA